MVNLDDETLHELRDHAKLVSKNAYCTYSKFKVGAVVLTEDGETFTGCNVENASYGLTICAERSAIFQMVAKKGQSRIRAIVIYTPRDMPSAPCGACRQVIYEFGREALVVSYCDSDKLLNMKITELLPEAFGPDDLGR